MSLLSKTPQIAEAPSVPILVRDAYVTDGARLFRVVSPMRPPIADGTAAVLEDCATLELTAYAPDELYAMALRAVHRHQPVDVAGLNI